MFSISLSLSLFESYLSIYHFCMFVRHILLLFLASMWVNFEQKHINWRFVKQIYFHTIHILWPPKVAHSITGIQVYSESSKASITNSKWENNKLAVVCYLSHNANLWIPAIFDFFVLILERTLNNFITLFLPFNFNVETLITAISSEYENNNS